MNKVLSALMNVDDQRGLWVTRLLLERGMGIICLIAFIVIGRAVGGLILVGFAATAWSMFVRPLHKRRYRKALAKLPSWEIEPD